jgi:hypothetical protein
MGVLPWNGGFGLRGPAQLVDRSAIPVGYAFLRRRGLRPATVVARLWPGPSEPLAMAVSGDFFRTFWWNWQCFSFLFPFDFVFFVELESSGLPTRLPATLECRAGSLAPFPFSLSRMSRTSGPSGCCGPWSVDCTSAAPLWPPTACMVLLSSSWMLS